MRHSVDHKGVILTLISVLGSIAQMTKCVINGHNFYGCVLADAYAHLERYCKLDESVHLLLTARDVVGTRDEKRHFTHIVQAGFDLCSQTVGTERDFETRLTVVRRPHRGRPRAADQHAVLLCQSIRINFIRP